MAGTIRSLAQDGLILRQSGRSRAMSLALSAVAKRRALAKRRKTKIAAERRSSEEAVTIKE